MADHSWAATRRSAVRLSRPWLDSPRRYIYVAIDGSAHADAALKWAVDNVLRFGEDHLILLSVGLLDLDVSDVLQESFDRLLGSEEPTNRTVTEKIALEQAILTLDASETRLLDHISKIYPPSATSPLSYELVAVVSDDPESAILDHVSRKDEILKHVPSRPAMVPMADCMLVVGSRGLGTLNRLLLGSVSGPHM
ncbi:hypothetical protein HDU67_006745 [Dinochytrium kinnereticum]|nr:hypothetical protein HDU67_006745 [Dinochytrium kinnereticum]